MNGKTSGKLKGGLAGLSVLAALAAALALGPGAALGAPGDLLRIFQKPTPAYGDSFGRSVAAVGSNVLVGAPYDGAGAEDAGAAYLFDGSTGQLLHTFLSPTPAYMDCFGWSVAAVGSNVLVGALRDDTGATDAGAAYLFDGSSGALLRTFVSPTPEGGDSFGRSVAAVGNKVLVGAPFDETGAYDAGVAYLFDASTGALLQTFLNPTPADHDRFGYSVAAVGGNVLVGACLDDTGAEDAGAAYLFDGSTGALLQTFLNPAPDPHDRFGFSVATVGGNVLVGAYYDDTGAPDAGAAYLFDASTGEVLRTFLSPTLGIGDFFGWSVAGVGGNVLVGAYYDDAGTTDAGAAYLFDGSTGALIATFVSPTPATHDNFGVSVAGAGGNVLVGAKGDDTGAYNAGAAFLFVPEPATLAILAAGGALVLLRRRRAHA